MKFLYPQFLYAFFTLLIPILIHLFYFRRFKTIYFSNVRFLSQLQEERNTSNRLRHLITLLTRMLILSALILAFAQPYIPGENSNEKAGKNAVSIYIDNSFSMHNVGQEGDLIELGKRKTSQILSRYREADQFQLLTNDFKVERQSFVNKADLSDQLSNVEVSPVSRNLDQVLQRQSAIFDNTKASNKSAFILSDFQKSTTQLNKINSLDSSINYYFLPLKGNQEGNIFIDSAWLTSPILKVNQTNTIQFKVVNESDEAINDFTGKLKLNGRQKGMASFDLEANETKTAEIAFNITETGWNTGKISISDYPITFDDTYNISFPVQETSRILSINGNQPNRFLNAVFKTDPYFNVTNQQTGNINFSEFSRYSLIIVNEINQLSSGLKAELIDFTSKGGNVLLLPPSDTTGTSGNYNSLLGQMGADLLQSTSKRVDDIENLNLDHPFFQNVFEDVPDNVQLPQVNKYYKMTSMAQTRKRNLLKLKNGNNILNLYPYEQGNLFLSAVPFNENWTNLPKHAIFVPVLYKISLYSSNPYNLAYTIGEDQAIPVQKTLISTDEVFKLKKNNFEVIPPQEVKGGKLTMYLSGQIEEAGFYKLVSNQREGEDVAMQPVYAFNHNRQESHLNTYPNETLTDFAANSRVRLIEDPYGTCNDK